MAGATGTWTEEKYEVISKDTELHVGDIVDLDFNIMSLFSWDVWNAVQLAAIEARLEKDDRFTLMRHSYPENNVVTFRVRVDKNPVAVAVLIAVIAGATVATAAFVWLTFREARRMFVEAPTAAVAATSSLGLIAVLALAGFIGFQWLRRRK
ncbi:MAG: hypothetical protein MUP30_08245 [Deltaproteobacteria bacterium]|nr:hypothetical protein [Deltaproteobacteria bacterium]